jgi:FMN reductase (NADPH)
MDNPVTQTMLNRKSIRHYKDKMPSDKTITAIVRAGQQAPFAAQLGSLLLSRKKKHPWGAPLMFTVCVDAHKLELVMARRGWRMVSNDLWVLVLGIQDATLMAENMVIAAESYGLASCFLGSAPYRAEKIIKEYKLPLRVFPLVQLVMGYPAQDPPPRPRYPLECVLFEDKYPQFDDETISQAMAAMDEGYLAQDYYRKLKAKIPLEGDRAETFTYENYGWTEHMSRKWGQWESSLDELLEQFAKCGFHISPTTKKE